MLQVLDTQTHATKHMHVHTNADSHKHAYLHRGRVQDAPHLTRLTPLLPLQKTHTQKKNPQQSRTRIHKFTCTHTNTSACFLVWFLFVCMCMCMRVSRKWSEPVPWCTISWYVFIYLQYLRPRLKGRAMPRALHHLIFRPPGSCFWLFSKFRYFHVGAHFVHSNSELCVYMHTSACMHPENQKNVKTHTHKKLCAISL